MYMGVLPAYIYAPHVCLGPTEAREVVGSPGTVAMDDCETPYEC